MQAWIDFLLQLDNELGNEVVDKWLRPLKVTGFDAANLYLEASDQFQALWFEEHVRKKAQKEFVNNNQRPIKIHLTIAHGEEKGTLNKSKKQIRPLASTGENFTLNFDQIDPQCTFDLFIETEQNSIAYKILTDLCGNKKKKESTISPFNPIYLFGGSGSGKTHLLMAAKDSLSKKGLEVIYTRAETFTEHVVSAIRAGEMSTFRQSYRNSDVLIIDDVHVFSRKGATQEELFHTFNTLHLAGKQIILSANCAPKELKLIEPRLVSRFEWGIVVQLDPLNGEGLKHLLERKSKNLNFPLNQKVMEFLLNTFTSGPKALCRSLEALVLRNHLVTRPISSTSLSVPLVSHNLKDLIEEETKLAVTYEKILQAVADSYGINPQDFLGKSQHRESVLPRQIAMYLCRSNLKMPYMKIGDLFMRDHSTVMSSIKQIQKGLDSGDQMVVDAINQISRKLKSSS